MVETPASLPMALSSPLSWKHAKGAPKPPLQVPFWVCSLDRHEGKPPLSVLGLPLDFTIPPPRILLLRRNPLGKELLQSPLCPTTGAPLKCSSMLSTIVGFGVQSPRGMARAGLGFLQHCGSGLSTKWWKPTAPLRGGRICSFF